MGICSGGLLSLSTQAFSSDDFPFSPVRLSVAPFRAVLDEFRAQIQSFAKRIYTRDCSPHFETS